MRFMKMALMAIMVLIVTLALMGSDGCGSVAEKKDRDTVDRQQQHYQKTQPVPFFSVSVPRDVFIQIYSIVCTGVHTTYTVIETVTGVTKHRGPSFGFPIPADTSLTNPLQPAFGTSDSAVIEQAEPNGLFPSKNTDGTWILFIQPDGSSTCL